MKETNLNIYFRSLRCVFILFKQENEHSSPAFVAGVFEINDANFVTCDKLSISQYILDTSKVHECLFYEINLMSI